MVGSSCLYVGRLCLCSFVDSMWPSSDGGFRRKQSFHLDGSDGGFCKKESVGRNDGGIRWFEGVRTKGSLRRLPSRLHQEKPVWTSEAGCVQTHDN